MSNLNIDDFRRAKEVHTVTVDGIAYTPKPLSVRKVLLLGPKFDAAQNTDNSLDIFAVIEEVLNAAQLPADVLLDSLTPDELIALTLWLFANLSEQLASNQTGLTHGTSSEPKASDIPSRKRKK